MYYTTVKHIRFLDILSHGRDISFRLRSCPNEDLNRNSKDPRTYSVLSGFDGTLLRGSEGQNKGTCSKGLGLGGCQRWCFYTSLDSLM